MGIGPRIPATVLRVGTKVMEIDSGQSFEDIEATLKKAAMALRDTEIPFLLGGSLASWARGGPESRHDLDLMVKPADAERALEALEAVGMRPQKPPEEWLYKAWDGDVMVDLIFLPKGIEVDDEVIARGDSLAVLSMEMRVMALEDVFVTKLMALSEHALRFEGVLRMARSLREQVDWEQVRRATVSSPFARAFFTLAEGLGVVPEPVPAEAGGGRPRVSVVTPLSSVGREAG
jgi:hypothetical protein